MPCKVAACKIVEPLFTASIAERIDLSDHCFLFFGLFAGADAVGADFERDLPRQIFLRPSNIKMKHVVIKSIINTSNKEFLIALQRLKLLL